MLRNICTVVYVCTHESSIFLPNNKHGMNVPSIYTVYCTYT